MIQVARGDLEKGKEGETLDFQAGFIGVKEIKGLIFQVGCMFKACPDRVPFSGGLYISIH